MMGRARQVTWGALLQVPFGHLGPLPPNMTEFFKLANNIDLDSSEYKKL